MFKLQPNPTFEMDVTIPRPDGEDGVITFVFKHKSKDALMKFWESLEGDSARKNEDAIPELVDGWKNVDVEYSAKALKQLLGDYHGAALAIYQAYGRGMVEGKQKN